MDDLSEYEQTNGTGDKDPHRGNTGGFLHFVTLFVISSQNY